MRKVLIACERSAVVRDAFRALGHDAWSCDLEPCEGDPRWHIQLDAVATATCHNWDLMIAHPECRYLSSSGLHWNGRRPGRAEKTKKALQFVEDLFACYIPLIALENPQGCINTQIPWMPKPQYIQPYQFGDDASKKTGLWLKGLPYLTLDRSLFVPPRMVCDCGVSRTSVTLLCPGCGAGFSSAKPRWANQTDSGQNRLGPSETRSAERARTYSGIAKAMAEQWGALL
jgi:hypothetical protein